MRNNRGLSYIEIIIFIVILGFAIPPLLIVTANIYNQSINMETKHVSTNLAQQKLEDTISRDFNTIASVATTNFPGQFSAYQYKVDVDYVTASDLDNSAAVTPTDFKRIIVSVNDPTVTGRTITFSTVVTDE